MALRVSTSSPSRRSTKYDAYPISPLSPSPLTEPEEEDVNRQSWRQSSPEEYDVANSPNDSYYVQDTVSGRNSANGKGKGKQTDQDEQGADTASPGGLDQAFNPDLISLEPLDDDEIETRRVEEVR